MEIRVLQSLISRNSAEIHGCEIMNQQIEELLADIDKEDVQMTRRRKNVIRNNLNRIKKLAEIQKALKREIANEVWCVRQDKSGFGL